MYRLADAAHYLAGLALLHPARYGATIAALLAAAVACIWVSWWIGGDR